MTPTQTIEAIYEAFSRRDIPRIFQLFSPEIEILQSEELPWGGHYHGHAGTLQFLTKLTASLNSTLEIERLVTASDQVAAIGWTQGTVNATGAAYRVPIAHLWKVRDGSIIRVEFIIDIPTMQAALAAPAAGT